MAKKKIKAKKGLRIIIILGLIIVLGIFALDFFQREKSFHIKTQVPVFP